MVGVFFAGYLSDQMGRKKVLILSAILFAVSAVGSAIPNNIGQFVVARFIGGLGVGMASMLSPLYISEIAPSHNRGMLVTLYQLAIVIGINLIYFVNLLIAGLGDEAWNVDTGWRYMLGSEAIPAILFLLLLVIVPESPRWLAKQGRFDEALAILCKINGAGRGEKVLEEVKNTLTEDVERGSLKDLFAPGLRIAMLVGIVLAIFFADHRHQCHYLLCPGNIQECRFWHRVGVASDRGYRVDKYRFYFCGDMVNG